MTLINMRTSPINVSYYMLEPICSAVAPSQTTFLDFQFPFLKMMFIPSVKSKSGVSCGIGMGDFVDSLKQTCLFEFMFDENVQVYTSELYWFHHCCHLVWHEVVLHHQVMWWMPMRMHSFLSSMNWDICVCRMLWSMNHLHLLVILVNDFFHGKNVVDVCHGPIGKGSWLMQISIIVKIFCFIVFSKVFVQKRNA